MSDDNKSVYQNHIIFKIKLVKPFLSLQYIRSYLFAHRSVRRFIRKSGVPGCICVNRLTVLKCFSTEKAAKGLLLFGDCVLCYVFHTIKLKQNNKTYVTVNRLKFDSFSVSETVL